MKKIIGALLAIGLMALPLSAQTSAYVTQAGVTFFVAQPATATATSGAVRLPTYSGNGVLNVVGAGIAGSPSGCTVALKYQSNAGGPLTSAVATQSFTPGNSLQQFTITPSTANGDNYVAVYNCSSTYPTAGTISLSFSPGPAPSSGTSGVNITQVDGTNLGAPSNYGTSPGAVSVPGVNAYVTDFPAVDPCQAPGVTKSSAEVAIASASTVQLVALSSGKKVYVCDLTVTAVGTSPSVQLITGTGSACGTADQTLTGAMIPSATVGVLHLGFGGSVAISNVSDELCMVAGGTASVQGIVTFVQQ